MTRNLPKPLLYSILIAGLFTTSCKNSPPKTEAIAEDEEHEMYDGPMERGALEIDKTKDPALGYVPVERLFSAIAYTEEIKAQNNYGTLEVKEDNILWTERGPSYDSVGASGNRRGTSTAPRHYTSGRIRAVFIDSSDLTGNTVFAGGVAGGLWKTTNFLDSIIQWQPINDYFDNLAITGICQDPSNRDIMYFCTGEAASNADAVLGRGVWKSENHGVTWTNLTSSIGFNRNFKILCDNSGYVYLATRGFGLRRSANKGETWVDITPAGLTALNPTFCTDIELSSTGKLHASFGYNTGSTNGAIDYRFTTNPRTVNANTWSTGVGIRTGSTVVANRLEIATLGDTLYAVTTSGTNNVDSTYRSEDGGLTWIKQNTNAYPTGVSNGQGWYNISLDINPANSGQFIVGGLDAYRSIDSGRTVQRQTFWVTSNPYVHADHHFVDWQNINGESRIIMASDGGLFLSRDNGATYKDKNLGLRIKQFYAVSLHPTNPNYMLAGAQDNGSHQFKYAGLASSTEVTGGDGCFVHINQKNPNIQFTSYVYNQYYRSVNGGVSWSSVNFSGSQGLFVNPFDFDDDKYIMYASNSVRDVPNNQIRRWSNANVSNTNTVLTIPELMRNGATNLGAPNSNPTAIKVSPYTPGRVYIGTNNGKLIRLDNADTIASADVSANVTDLTGANFPFGYINCINTGTTDNNLVAIFTNYGIQNVWVTTNGGTSWTKIDGNLPDMPVRWAVFHPGDNDKLMLATEAGIYTTLNINGDQTEWMPSPGFPTVRTDMLKFRASDNTVAAATHGRGIFTGNILNILPIRSVTLAGLLAADGKARLNWKPLGATSKTRYRIQYSTDGVSFTQIAEVANTLQYAHSLTSAVGYYRIMAIEATQAPVFSNVVAIRNTKPVKGLQVRVIPNPIVTSGSFVISGGNAGNMNWQILNLEGKIMETGRGVIAAGATLTVPIRTTALHSGMYKIKVMVEKEVVTTSFIKH